MGEIVGETEMSFDKDFPSLKDRKHKLFTELTLKVHCLDKQIVKETIEKVCILEAEPADEYERGVHSSGKHIMKELGLK